MVPDSMRSRFFALLGIINVLSIILTSYFIKEACEEVYEPKVEASYCNT